mgnify:CR=1 FL=1
MHVGMRESPRPRTQQPAAQAFRNASTSWVLTLPSPLMSAEPSPAAQAFRNASTSWVFTAPSPVKSAAQGTWLLMMAPRNPPAQTSPLGEASISEKGYW